MRIWLAKCSALPPQGLLALALLLGAGCAETLPASSLVGIAVSPPTVRALVGDTQVLAALPSPAGAMLPKLHWTSSAPEIAQVDGHGLLFARAPGVAIIVVRAGDVEGRCRVTVRSQPIAVSGCKAADPLNPATFPDCPVGGGIFGEWIVDRLGLPAFDYRFDQVRDPRAPWPNSESVFPLFKERRDHFILLGNNRVNFMAVNDGYVTLFGNERGPTWMNRFSEEQHNLGGGFSWVAVDGEAWPTAYRWAPADAETRRVFGSGYFLSETTHFDLRVGHTVHAPAGSDPLLIDEVEIENLSSSVRQVTHWEYWDVNRHQLRASWVRTGLAAGPSDDERDALNGYFLHRVDWDAGQQTMVASMWPKPGFPVPATDAISALDWYPPPIFLTLLSAEAPSDVFGDQDAFMGAGTPELPEAVLSGRSGALLQASDGMGQRACLVMRHDLVLAPGEVKRLRFAYGYLPAGVDLSLVEPYRDPTLDLLAESALAWRRGMVLVDVPGRPLLHRESAWRSQQLASATVWNDYYGDHYTPQGSAYLYLHGVDGAPRDQALFSVAATWLDPALAKGNLRLIMKLTDVADGEISYSFSGHGVNEGAIIHEHPSDLDIFFLLALGEYVAATGDRGFLDELVSFYPRGPGFPSVVDARTVLDHARVAFRHLKDAVGVGPNGLVRIHDGDWNDGIVYEDPSPFAITYTIENGESVPNTQMAVYALRKLAGLITALDPELAGEMRAYAAALAAAGRQAFGTRWFARAWLRNAFNEAYLKGNDRVYDDWGNNYLDLEAQPWGLLADLLDDGERERLLDEIDARLSSPIGPKLRPGGAVWPAVAQLMTWAWARHRPWRAWESLEAQLYATHAQLWPASWVGVWSGPDGFELDGGTWASAVTPMTDFPVSNMNPEAMWVVGLLRAAGIETTADGIRIAATGAHREYAIHLPLLTLEVLPNHMGLTYHAQNDGEIVLRIVVPSGATAVVTVYGRESTAAVVEGALLVPIAFVAGDEVPVTATWR